jgi:hypothetical protein
METAVDSSVSLKLLILIGMLGLVVLLLWKHRRAGIYVGIGLAIVVMGGMLLYRFTGDESAQRYKAQAQVEVIRQEEAARRDSYSSVDPIWQVTVENEFEADVYPSVETAAEALGQKIAPKVSALALQRKPASKGYILTSNHGNELGEYETKALDSVWQELNTIIKVPAFRIEKIAEDPERKNLIRSTEDALKLFVTIPSLGQGQAPWTQSGRQHTAGTLEVAVRYGAEGFKESIAFIEKPWVTNFSLFLSQAPGEHYIIAQSKQPCTSSSEARYEAMEDAAEQLAYRIMENAGRYREQFNLGKRSRWKWGDIQSLVRTELEDSQSERSQATAESYSAVTSDVSYVNSNHKNRHGKYISDRFVQGFARPYGKVWREALLVNASKGNIDELAGLYANTIREKRESWLRIVLSALGMLGIVCAVYVFLNSATKGYYRAALRVAAVVLALAIIGVAVVLA